MPFFNTLTISPNTSNTSPASLDFELYPMTVRRVEITFPSGLVGLVSCWFKYHSRQVWPINTLGRFKGENQTITFNPDLIVSELPHTLTMYATNDDDTYPHTLYVLIDGDMGKDFWKDFWSRMFPLG